MLSGWIHAYFCVEGVTDNLILARPLEGLRYLVLYRKEPRPLFLEPVVSPLAWDLGHGGEVHALCSTARHEGPCLVGGEDEYGGRKPYEGIEDMVYRRYPRKAYGDRKSTRLNSSHGYI